jgi:hypothetical protein
MSEYLIPTYWESRCIKRQTRVVVSRSIIQQTFLRKLGTAVYKYLCSKDLLYIKTYNTWIRHHNLIQTPLDKSTSIPNHSPQSSHKHEVDHPLLRLSLEPCYCDAIHNPIKPLQTGMLRESRWHRNMHHTYTKWHRHHRSRETCLPSKPRRHRALLYCSGGDRHSRRQQAAMLVWYQRRPEMQPESSNHSKPLKAGSGFFCRRCREEAVLDWWQRCSALQFSSSDRIFYGGCRVSLVKTQRKASQLAEGVI